MRSFFFYFHLYTICLFSHKILFEFLTHLDNDIYSKEESSWISWCRTHSCRWSCRWSWCWSWCCSWCCRCKWTDRDWWGSRGSRRVCWRFIRYLFAQELRWSRGFEDMGWGV